MVVSAGRVPLWRQLRSAARPFQYRNCTSDQTTRSRLALRTPEGRAAVLGEAFDHAAAAAFLTLAIVDQEVVLEIAELARGLAMVAQRRAARLDRLVQHGVNRLNQSVRM